MHKKRFCNFSEDIHGLIPEKKIVCNVENNWELRAQNTFSSPGNYKLSIMDKKTWGDLFASFEMPVSLFPFLSVSLMLSTQGILKNGKKKKNQAVICLPVAKNTVWLLTVFYKLTNSRVGSIFLKGQIDGNI